MIRRARIALCHTSEFVILVEAAVLILICVRKGEGVEFFCENMEVKRRFVQPFLYLCESKV